jgi:hypothetical protein
MTTLRELRASFRGMSGCIGAVEFVMHPDDLHGALAREAEDIKARLVIDLECPPGRIYCRQVEADYA